MSISRIHRIAASCLLALAFPWHSVTAGDPGRSLGRKLTTQQRMETKHLKAATDAVAAHQAARRPVVLQSGYQDYRSILHAHAEDSAHTGGTRVEMLEDAKRAAVSVVMLTDHFRPPRDFMTESWRGLHDGVLFIPGSETHGFLIHPTHSIMESMPLTGPPFIEAVTADGGLIFLSHIEARFRHPMDGLTGMEIYNRHADSIDDIFALLSLGQVVADPARYAEFSDALAKYPDAMFATQLDYPQMYLIKWDEETQHRRVVGIAANDCHHNMVIIAKVLDAETLLIGSIMDKDEGMRKLYASGMPGIREITAGREPGDIVARLDFDPYHISFHNVSTHILASELNEEAIREALREGRAYVSHDWMCDPTGFVFGARESGRDGLTAVMGAELPYHADLRLVAEFPVECGIRLLKDGEEVLRQHSRALEHEPDGPGVYRVEGWLEVDTEDRVWIYSNPVYLR